MQGFSNLVASYAEENVCKIHIALISSPNIIIYGKCNAMFKHICISHE